jgi:hypothetical protein
VTIVPVLMPQASLCYAPQLAVLSQIVAEAMPTARGDSTRGRLRMPPGDSHQRPSSVDVFLRDLVSGCCQFLRKSGKCPRRHELTELHVARRRWFSISDRESVMNSAESSAKAQPKQISPSSDR